MTMKTTPRDLAELFDDPTDARAGARTTGAPLKAETAEVKAIDSMMRVDATCIAKAQAARGQHGVQAVDFSMLTG